LPDEGGFLQLVILEFSPLYILRDSVAGKPVDLILLYGDAGLELGRDGDA